MMDTPAAHSGPASLNISLPEHEPMVHALLAWFSANMRPLPWRTGYDPYHVWVSEIMLQQTQMERGVAYFERWMRQFPTLQSVAEAEPDTILKAWEGLGYYSRARNLHAAAKLIMREHSGVFPVDFSAILALPGVGKYTAGAIVSIAYNQPVAAVDANVERVFSRLFDIDSPVKSTLAGDFISHMAAALIPEGKSRLFNQALMELGALVCGKVPRCGQCPLGAFCRAKHLGIALERPVPGKKTEYTALEIITGVLVHHGRVFIQKRLDSGVWAGFWEFPGGRLEPGESPEQGVVREFYEETEFPVRVSRHLGLVRHAYTRYRIVMHCFVCELPIGSANQQKNSMPPEMAPVYPCPVLHAATEYRWVSLKELENFTLPAGHRKLLDAWSPLLAELLDTAQAT